MLVLVGCIIHMLHLIASGVTYEHVLKFLIK